MTATGDLPFVPATPLGAAVVVTVAIVSSTGFYGVLQAIINRQGRIAEAARMHAEAEKLQGESDLARVQFLLDSQLGVQRTAQEAADLRYKNLSEDYHRNLAELRGLRRVAAALIYAVESLVSRCRPGRNSDSMMATIPVAEYLAARDAISAAREHLQ